MHELRGVHARKSTNQNKTMSVAVTTGLENGDKSSVLETGKNT